MTITRIEPFDRASMAVIHGGTAYFAGQVADDPVPDITAQTTQILAQLDAILAKAGSSKERLLSVTTWLADIRYYDAMNLVWDAWVVPGSAPARATVEAKLAGPEYLIEIGAIAAVG